MPELLEDDGEAPDDEVVVGGIDLGRNLELVDLGLGLDLAHHALLFVGLGEGDAADLLELRPNLEAVGVNVVLSSLILRM